MNIRGVQNKSTTVEDQFYISFSESLSRIEQWFDNQLTVKTKRLSLLLIGMVAYSLHRSPSLVISHSFDRVINWLQIIIFSEMRALCFILPLHHLLGVHKYRPLESGLVLLILSAT